MRKKVIIFAPHQDDEILACAGTIDLLKKTGADVYIVFATNGDFYGRESAAIRLRESIVALKSLNISENNIKVLGFADTGMEFDDSFLWKLYHNTSQNEVVKSMVSDTTYHPCGLEEYSVQKLGRHLPYTQNAFSQILEFLIIDIKPDIVFVSSILDAHGDHAALCRFVLDAIKKTGTKIPIYQYIIHSGDDKNWPQRNSQYYNKPPNISDALWKKRVIVNLSDTTNKCALIRLFKSQLSPSGYLLSFAKREEFFFDSKEVDYS